MSHGGHRLSDTTRDLAHLNDFVVKAEAGDGEVEESFGRLYRVRLHHMGSTALGSPKNFVPVGQTQTLGEQLRPWPTLYATQANLSRLTLSAGVAANSGGVKHARVTTGSIGASSSAAVTITWTTAFADANYTVNVSVVEATASTSTLRVHHIESISASAVVVRVVNDDAGGAHTGTLHATAMHD